ncbi:hypothetical protein R1sor_006810 [Riccia sorocarpa]|uniref:Origin recognition complex subunit 2 n=1 Tax=Riccia sorocarpa TaxID=122646 RepID=A0ABD3HRI9_9MARC
MKTLTEVLEKVAPKHVKEQAALVASYKTFYDKWHFELTTGFSLLMYGFGSKKALLEDFAMTALADGPVVVVNGYLPVIRIKNVVFTIASALWEQSRARTEGCVKRKKLSTGQPLPNQSLEDLMIFIREKPDSEWVYILVNNIDGPGVRDDDIQRTLALLAACPCVRMVASIDNVNAPLLWDKQMANAQFNWWWHHTPTYDHYSVEGTYLPLLLTSGGSLETIKSSSLVLKSLTPNAQSVFKTLAQFQLAHPDDQGLPLHQLYTSCRDQFLVSSELTLRAHLTEFKDHELVRWRRGNDGQDCLFIPMTVDALTKLLHDVFQ